MNVRWTAVLTGFIVDIVLSTLVSFFATAEFFRSPDVTRPSDIILICLLTISTGIGGYVAGRLSGTSRAMNGFLVAIVGILLGLIAPPLPRVFVVSSAIACGLAALGGYLSRYPAEQTSRSSRRQ